MQESLDDPHSTHAPAATASDAKAPVQPHELTLRAERCLCFAQALLPPREAGQEDALRNDLAADLEALATELGEATPASLADLRNALTGAFGQRGGPLRSYAALFLTPPAPARLNTGCYLDGGLMGQHTDILDAWYHKHGVQRASGFRDLPDHAAAQLEFLAILYARAAEALEADDENRAWQLLGEIHGFLGAFPANWVPPLRRDIAHCVEGPQAPEQFYLSMVDLLGEALTRDRAWLTRVGVAAQTPSEPAPARAEELATTEAPPVDSPEARAFMIEQLRAAGLDTSHLAAPARDANMGMQPMRPVEPRGHGHQKSPPNARRE